MAIRQVSESMLGPDAKDFEFTRNLNKPVNGTSLPVSLDLLQDIQITKVVYQTSTGTCDVNIHDGSGNIAAIGTLSASTTKQSVSPGTPPTVSNGDPLSIVISNVSTIGLVSITIHGVLA